MSTSPGGPSYSNLPYVVFHPTHVALQRHLPLACFLAALLVQSCGRGAASPAGDSAIHFPSSQNVPLALSTRRENPDTGQGWFAVSAWAEQGESRRVNTSGYLQGLPPCLALRWHCLCGFLGYVLHISQRYKRYLHLCVYEMKSCIIYTPTGVMV